MEGARIELVGRRDSCVGALGHLESIGVLWRRLVFAEDRVHAVREERVKAVVETQLRALRAKVKGGAAKTVVDMKTMRSQQITVRRRWRRVDETRCRRRETAVRSARACLELIVRQFRRMGRRRDEDRARRRRECGSRRYVRCGAGSA